MDGRMMKVKFTKLNSKASTPKYAHSGDAAIDLVATECATHEAYIEYKTGLAIEIPEGHVGLLFPRSSVSKHRAMLANSVGVIDSNYRGEIAARFYCTFPPYEVGDRVCQLMILPLPQIELVEVDSLNESNRGECGFGSTGA